MGANDVGTFYSPDNCELTCSSRLRSLTVIVVLGAFLNDTVMPVTNNYDKPTVPFFVNGKSDPTSQRFHVRYRWYKGYQSLCI